MPHSHNNLSVKIAENWEGNFAEENNSQNKTISALDKPNTVMSDSQAPTASGLSTSMDANSVGQTQRELTFGEKLVGLTFNPSNDDKVGKAKMLCAELADLLKNEYDMRETGGTLSERLYNHAIGEILNAQMNVVKVLTLKY